MVVVKLQPHGSRRLGRAQIADKDVECAIFGLLDDNAQVRAKQVAHDVVIGIGVIGDVAGILSIRPIIVVMPSLRNVVVAEILLTNSVFEEGHKIAIDRGLGFFLRTIDQGVSRQKREIDAVERSGLDLHQLGQVDGEAVPLAVVDIALRSQLNIPIEYHTPDAGQLRRPIPIVYLKKLVHIGIGYPHDGQPHGLEIDRLKRKDSPRSSGHDHTLRQRTYPRLEHFKIH